MENTLNKSITLTKITDNLLTICGTGKVLVTGESAAEECSVLWLRNVRAEHVVSLNEALLSSLGEIDTVFCLDFSNKVPTEETALLLNRLYQAGPRSVCIYAGFTPEGAPDAQIFERWEQAFFEAGFRRHPRLFHALDYCSREQPPAHNLLCFERIPEAALERYSLQRLHASRRLHMDMLRDAGRRSDAHLMRYFTASSFIRPGDTVLDCACGSGYGSHMLYSNSRARRVVGIDCDSYAVDYAASNYADPGVIDFVMADAQNLSDFADNSFDFIACFETIEHVPAPEKCLRELFRVLRPSGRIMISAPDIWVDESGKALNPHHLHVYTWDKLYAETASLFIPEKGFVQIAGGALKLPQGTRQWREIPCKPGQSEKAEWVILTAMKSPLYGRDVFYQETTFPETDNPDYHVGAFAGEYINPWLLKGMVSIGYRLQNADALQELQDRVLEEYPSDSVDYGAALCGKCYALLSANISQENKEILCKLIEDYVALNPSNPHVMRWQVSLLFASGLLRRKCGDLEEAETLFMRCASVDVAPYSPLLGNKTLDALYNATMLALGRGDTAAARERLTLAMEEAIRLSKGSWLNVILDVKKPFEPGFPEMAQLMDKASRCCYMLGELGNTDKRPWWTYSSGKGFYELRALYSQRFIDFLLEQKTFLDKQVIEYQKQINELLVDRDRYKNSKIWRMTAPLRKFVNLLRTLRNNLIS